MLLTVIPHQLCRVIVNACAEPCPEPGRARDLPSCVAHVVVEILKRQGFLPYFKAIFHLVRRIWLVGADKVYLQSRVHFEKCRRLLPTYTVGQVVVEEKYIWYHLLKLVNPFFQRVGIENFIVSPVQISLQQQT
jgi:hypothetical protein